METRSKTMHKVPDVTNVLLLIFQSPECRELYFYPCQFRIGNSTFFEDLGQEKLIKHLSPHPTPKQELYKSPIKMEYLGHIIKTLKYTIYYSLFIITFML